MLSIDYAGESSRPPSSNNYTTVPFDHGSSYVNDSANPVKRMARSSVKNVRLNEKMTLRLVEFYRDQRVLWDKEKKAYYKREDRLRAYQQIAVSMSVKGLGVPELVSKIQNIRSVYRQELKKIKQHSAKWHLVKSEKWDVSSLYVTKLSWFPILYSMIGDAPVERLYSSPSTADMLSIDYAGESSRPPSSNNYTTVPFDHGSSYVNDSANPVKRMARSSVKNVRLNEKMTLRLVEFYRDQRVLWDKEKKAYYKREDRLRAYQQIAVSMSVKGLGVPELVSKIQNIRSVYRRELKKIKQHSAKWHLVKSEKWDVSSLYVTKLSWFPILYSMIGDAPVERLYSSPSTADMLSEKWDVSSLYVTKLSWFPILYSMIGDAPVERLYSSPSTADMLSIDYAGESSRPPSSNNYTTAPFDHGSS